jgi:sterol 3beta-glucosyltransferase
MITILCTGSRGDYQPYIALAQRLKKLGKEVRITASKSFEPFVRNYGIEVYPVEADLYTLDIDPKLMKQASSADNPLKMLLAFNKMKDYGVLMTRDYYNACLGSELIIYHPGVTIGYFAAEKLGIPSVLASPFPINKTKEVLSVVMYGKNKSNPLSINLSYTMIQGMLWMASGSSVKSFWKSEFKVLPKGFSKPYEKHNNKNHPALISCSDHIFKRPKDWNEHIHQYGYWFVEEQKECVPSKELDDFLKQGDRPIYVGFGSMAINGKSEELGEMAIEALRKIGKRGIISGMGSPKNSGSDMLLIDNVPHTWLFDQVDAVCHHGGAGTSATGFRAGVPSIIIPFANDQFAWAYRAYDLGIGSKPLPKKELTVERLVIAFKDALSEPIITNSKEMGRKIRLENGAYDCAEIIKRTLAK